MANSPPRIPRPEPVPLARSPRIDALTARVRGLDAAAAQRVVREFWAGVAAAPLVDDDDDDGGPVGRDAAGRDAVGRDAVGRDAAGRDAAGRDAAGRERIVTFLLRDSEAADVLLLVNRLSDPERIADSLMRRVPGTDAWHLSYRMRSDWRASYSFVPRLPGADWPWPEGRVNVRAAFSCAIPDPLGREVTRSRAGRVQSVVSLADAPAQPWCEPADSDAPRARPAAHEGPGGRTVWVHRAGGGDLRPGTSSGSGAAGLPVVVALDGEVWNGPQDLPTTADNLVAGGETPPFLLVLLDSGGLERRWADLGGDGGAVAWLADQLLPWVRERWGAGDAGAFVAGQSLGGLTALQCVLERPETFAGAISQSASLWKLDLGQLVVGAPAPEPVPGGALARRIYLEVGTQEWILREPNELLAAALAAAGHDVRYVEYNGGHDYACWRGGIADGLRYVLSPGTSRSVRRVR